MPDYREFYVSGGTLRPDAPCYVERRADRELWDAVRRGEFCYVLTPRQMGKSSLMVRTAYRLRAAGVHAAILDLTTLGGNVTPEQWYFGLLTLLGDQLDLDAELESYWYAHSGHGPLRRLIAAIEQVVLPQLATRQRPHADLTAPDAPRLVIFIDEIDTVRSLTFPTDEFFAAVRELYNRRAAEPALRHLTLCLLGVATPADLIRESRSTPFNIGRCVELDDFTLDEALPLAMGLTRKSAQSLGGDERQGPAPEAQQLLGRVVYWTGGHPYLTQKLCLAVAEALASRDSALPLRARARESLVDGACAWLFFEPHAMQRDDSLLFVQERMLRADPAGSEELAARLERYRQVRGHGRWRRSPVRADATDPVLALLRLSGITRTEGGFLVPRNRIYARLFDEAWIRSRMPDAELRRQRQAFRAGVLRTTAIAGLVVAGMGTLAAYALYNQHRANTALRRMGQEARRASAAEARERGERLLAEQRGKETRRQVARMQVDEGVRRAGDRDPFRGLLNFVEALRIETGDAERATGHRLRIGSLLETAPRLVRLLSGSLEMRAADFSPDNTRLATADGASVRIWRTDSGDALTPPLQHSAAVTQVIFSPDERSLLTATADGWLFLRGVENGAPRVPKLRLGGQTVCADFSPDGSRVAAGNSLGIAYVWSAATGGRTSSPLRHTGKILQVRLSRDGRRVVTASADRTARIWDSQSGKPLTPPLRHERAVELARLSPDDSILATSDLGNIRLWSTLGGKLLGAIHGDQLRDFTFSPEGDLLLVSNHRQEVRAWNVLTLEPIGPVLGHERPVVLSGFTMDGGQVLTVSQDGAITHWDPRTGRIVGRPQRLAGRLSRSWGSSDDRFLLCGSADGVGRLWDLAPTTGLAGTALVSGARCVTRSQDGLRLAAGGPGETARVYDARTGRALGRVIHHGERVTALGFGPDGLSLAVGGETGRVGIYATATGRLLRTLLPRGAACAVLRCSPCGKWMVSVDRTGGLGIWDLRTGLRRKVGYCGSAPASVIYDPKGAHVVLHLENGEIWRYLVSTSGQDLSGPSIEWDINALTFNPDSTRMLLASGAQVIRRDTTSWREVGRILLHSAPVRTIAYSRDGLRFATGADDGVVRIWDSGTVEPVSAPLVHAEPLCHLAFSPDGQRLATMTVSGEVQVWDPSQGEPLLLPRRLGEGWGEVAFTPTGDRVIAVYAGGSAAAVDFRPATGSVPDLVRLSGLLSGNRLEPETGVIPLSAAEVSQASRELTATPFSQLKPRAGVALAWHRAEATRGEALRLWPAAIRHLSALVTAAPGDPELRRRRGNAYAELGRWQEAARDYADALDRGEIRHPEWYRTALTQLAARDTAGYRRTCTRMLDRFERSTEARPRDLTAWTCAFGPSAPLDLARAVRLTQDLLRAEPENHSFRETLGALFLRAGRLREASACLREVIARDDTGGSAATHLFLARCESRLGNREAARQELVRGRERLTRDGAPGLPWDDRLERTLLQREAETAVSP